MTTHSPVPSDGFDSRWRYINDAIGDDAEDPRRLPDSDAHERLEIRWDNEAWTMRVELGTHRAEAVVRLSPFWQTSQLLLFRDLPEPDLWLGTDGRGGWGEVNGSHRVDLDDISDIVIPGSVSTIVPMLRRSTLAVGETESVPVGVLDPDTLGVTAAALVLHRTDGARWHLTTDGGDLVDWELTTDEFGIPTVIDGWARRLEADDGRSDR